MRRGLEVGDALAPWVMDSVDPEAMRGLAELLDDPNPIHLDAQAAAALGLGDRQVNQGPANCAYVINMLREAFPDGELRAMRFRFKSPVHAGDRVVAGGRITERTRRGRVVTFVCDAWLDVSGGGRAVVGTATIVTDVPSVST
jgi:3-hydroxybutyryl-CoA dehydratase